MSRRLLFRGGVLAAVAMLGACAAPTPAPPALDAAPPTRPAVAAAPDTTVDTFVQQQTARAMRAEVRGDWAAAVLAWESVSLVRPDDGQVRERLVELRRRIAGQTAEHLQSAEAAQRRGDWDAAGQAYLAALALDPWLRSAADALRQLERERTRRSLVARSARAAQAAARPGPAGEAADASEGPRGAGAWREHATLLSRQGDFDAAIQLVRDASGRNDKAARSLLADLYVQKAESLRLRQPEAARAAVEAALDIDRRHPAALALWARLPPLPKGRSSPPAAPASAR